MSKLLQIGITYPPEMPSGIGHMACTLGGVNYESRGHRGVLKGSAARGAAHPLFRHHFYRVLNDPQAARAKAFADSCVGLPYVWDGVPHPTPPKRGTDCSGLASAIYCVAFDHQVRHLFDTGSWAAQRAHLGFNEGLGPGSSPDLADRPYPGHPIHAGSPKAGHIRWIQARLNYAGHGHPLAVDGEFGPLTLAAVKSFQSHHALAVDGIVGAKTWAALNAVR